MKMVHITSCIQTSFYNPKIFSLLSYDQEKQQILIFAKQEVKNVNKLLKAIIH